MSLSAAISNASSGLAAAGRRADIVASNIANAATPGYVRRSVALSEHVLGGRGAGVRTAGVVRSYDAALTAERRTLLSDRAQAAALSGAWRTLSAQVGDNLSDTGLFASVSQLRGALQDAALTPESDAGLQAVLDAARRLTGDLGLLHDRAVSMRAEADAEIAEGVRTVNNALESIVDLNTRIASANPATSEAAGLRDERGRMLDVIAEYMPVEAIEREGGAIDVMTPEGVFLVAGEARPLQFDPSGAFAPQFTLDNGDLSGLSSAGAELTPGAPAHGALSSGLFGALFTLRDQDLPEFLANLDVVAGDLIGRFGEDSIDPTKPAGEPGLFVDSAQGSGPGVAGRLTVNPALDPVQGGEIWRLRAGVGAPAPGEPSFSAILNGMAGAMETPRTLAGAGFSGAFTSAGLAAHMASLAGQSRLSHDSVLTSTSAQLETLVEAEHAVSGVDIDTEMQSLLEIEQAYAANARVLETINQMMNRLLEL